MAAGRGGSARAGIQYTEDLGHRLLEIVVHHPMVELLCSLHLVLRIGHTQGERRVVLGLPSVQALAKDVARGRLDEDEKSVGNRVPDRHRSLDVDLQQNRLAVGQGFLHLVLRRPVAVSVDGRLFKEAPRGDQRVEVLVGKEVVVPAVPFPSAGAPCGRGYRRNDLRTVREHTFSDRGLAGPRRTRDHEELRCRARRRAGYFSLNSASRACFCFSPRPRMRRDVETSSFSMIFLARTLPTPGRASRTADTFIFPTVLSVGCCRICVRVNVPFLSCCFTSARARRASAAFSRAIFRCSSVKTGSGMFSPSDRRPPDGAESNT